jgi:hypothetical protein
MGKDVLLDGRLDIYLDDLTTRRRREGRYPPARLGKESVPGKLVVFALMTLTAQHDDGSFARWWGSRMIQRWWMDRFPMRRYTLYHGGPGWQLQLRTDWILNE